MKVCGGMKVQLHSSIWQRLSSCTLHIRCFWVETLAPLHCRSVDAHIWTAHHWIPGTTALIPTGPHSYTTFIYYYTCLALSPYLKKILTTRIDYLHTRYWTSDAYTHTSFLLCVQVQRTTAHVDARIFSPRLTAVPYVSTQNFTMREDGNKQ